MMREIQKTKEGDILMKKKMLLIVLSAFMLTGCSSSGVPQEQYESVVAERDEYKSQLETDKLSTNDVTEKISVEYDTLLNNLNNSVNKKNSVEYSVIKINSVEDFDILPSGTLLYYIGNGGTGMYDLESWAILSSEIDGDGNRIILHCQPQGSFQDEIYSTIDSILIYGNVYAFIEFDDIQISDINSEESTADTNNISELSSPIDLSTGKYIVGEDIPSGKYDIIGIEKGNIYVSSNGGKSANELIESIEPEKSVYNNIRLENGYEVEIVLGGKVQLQPK
mgnify:CR=1 FL=1